MSSQMTPNFTSFFKIERVEGKRTVHGRTEYLVKWKNHPRTMNAWRPVETLSCQDLIQQYEQRLYKIKNVSTISGKSKVSGNKSTKEVFEEAEKPKISGLDAGWDCEKIIGATFTNGTLCFLIQWKDTQEMEFIPSKEANERWPQLVIQFYEQRITWETPNALDEEVMKSTAS